jgi:hypothetical protein
VSQWSKTRGLVLKYRMDRSAREEAQRAEAFDRLMSPAFPPELLRQVVKKVVQHHACYWSAAGEDTLEMRGGRIFQFPDSVAPPTRSLLQHLAKEDFLKLSIVRTPAFFTAEHTLQLPPSLDENSQHLHLRHLVLGLRTTPIHNGYNRELNKGITTMSSLPALFPRVEACVFLLHFKNVRQNALVPFGRGFFNADMLRFTNARFDNASGKWERVDLEATILEFMLAFARDGPGKRKLLRFSTNKDVFDMHGTSCDAGVGPLVDVSGLVGATGAGEAGEDAACDLEEGADHENSSPACAECVFKEAYWSPRVLQWKDGTKGIAR